MKTNMIVSLYLALVAAVVTPCQQHPNKSAESIFMEN
jgi:hypothetical protein